MSTNEQKLRIAAQKVLDDWYTLASSLPQNDAIEALEWGAMHELRNALALQPPAPEQSKN